VQGLRDCRRLIGASVFSDAGQGPLDQVGSPALADRLRRGHVAVGTCRAIRIPLTLGWRRPTILLPTDWRRWGPAKLDAALAHELAHVERRDALFMLIGAVNLCVYWFHPLAWLLPRRLSALAERACDDRAMTLTGQRTQYARHLLEFAASMVDRRSRVSLVELSLADGGDLRTRITAILDRRRPLAPLLNRRGVA